MDKKNLYEINIWEFVAPYLQERAGRIYTQNNEYQEAQKKGDLLFEQLDSTLNEEQSELLEQYFSANNAVVDLIEQLVYQQGMKDMLELLISLLKND